jgi:peptide/nickel transport system permease protein
MLALVTRLARRLVAAGASVGLVVALSVLLMQAAPGRFGDELRLDPGLSRDTLAAVERAREAGDPSMAMRRWVRGAVRGDLGRSLASGVPVVRVLGPRVAHTLLLTVPATVLAWALALLVVRRLVRPPLTPPVRWAGALLAVTQSLPDVVVALVLVRLALASGWFPVGGVGGWSRDGNPGAWAELAWHAVLPVAGLTALMLPSLVRHVYASVAAVADAPFVRAATARGVGRTRRYARHILPMALPAMAPMAGLSIASLLGASLIVEVVFTWPGLGPLMVDAVLARDTPVVLGAVCASAVLVVVANAISDAVQYLADPRLRA